MSTGLPPVAGPREKVRADIADAELSVDVGESAAVTIEITNLDVVIRSFHVTVLGVDPDCVVVDPPVVDLFPQERRSVLVTVSLPDEHPAGRRTIAVEVGEPHEDAPAPAVAEFVLDVRGIPGLRVATEPTTLEMGGAGTFIVHLTNTGNTTLEPVLVAQDAERLLTVTFDTDRPIVAPGEQGVVQGTVTGPRPWFGMPAVRLLEVSAGSGDTVALGTLAIVQRPRFGRRLIAFLGLLLVVTLFAYLIQRSFARVAELSAENEALVRQGLGFADDAAARVAPAGLSGSVVSSTGTGIDGAAVELFEEGNLLRPLHSTVTSQGGAFRFPAVADGTYLVRTQAAGFGELWYPEALTFEDAEVIEVADGKPVEGIDVVIAGRPGLVAGTVLGADVEGAIVRVQVPAEAIVGSDIPAVPSIVQTAVVDATGRFVLPDLATPANYQVVVSKPGYATETRTVQLGAGEQREGIDILLRRGIGRIAGTVVDTSGTAVGGVVITGTDGTSQNFTRSLSGDLVGTFELRDLATPATYTLNFTAPGFFGETVTLVLEAEQQRDDLVVVMSRDRGSLTGTVRASDGRPLGGVTVAVVGAEGEQTTESLSVGEVGTWLVGSIPVPGTYTVTFTAEGFTTTALSVDLGLGPEAVRRDVDAVLVPDTGSIHGVVTDTSEVPISGVQVTLEGSDIQRRTISSDQPPGAYVFDGVPPGVYTLTYERSGSTPQTLLVDLAPGDRLDLDPVRLERQARIVGIVTRNGIGTADIGVVVYQMGTYPNGVVVSTVTGPGGTFEIVGIDAPETYIIEFQVPAGGAAVDSRVVFLQPDQVVELEVDL